MGALLKSKEYVRSNWFDVFLRAFVIWLISVGLGFIPVVGPILWILFVPFVIIFIKLIYEDLRDLKGKVVLHPYVIGGRIKWIGAGALGYVAFPVILFLVMSATFTVPLLTQVNPVTFPSSVILRTRSSVMKLPPISL